MEAAGIVVPRSVDKLATEIETFVVAEREQRVLACAQLKPIGASETGDFEKMGEVAAFCVHPDFRGSGALRCQERFVVLKQRSVCYKER